MAATTKAQPAYPRASRRGSKMQLGLAGNPMVNVGLRLIPFIPTGTGRLAGHYVCREHLGPVKNRAFCEEHGEQCETVLAYEWDGKTVEIEQAGLGADADKRLELQAMLDPAAIDPLYFEKPYLLEPEAGEEAAFDLFAAALRESGQAAVGTAVLNKATKVIVVRWSQATGSLVAHACSYDARLAWADAHAIRDGHDARPQVDAKQAAEAAGLFASTLADEFDFSTVEDEYAAELEAAVEAAAHGVAPKAKPQPPTVEPVVDLMAALRASVEQASAKPKGKRNGGKKVAA